MVKEDVCLTEQNQCEQTTSWGVICTQCYIHHKDKQDTAADWQNSKYVTRLAEYTRANDITPYVIIQQI